MITSGPLEIQVGDLGVDAAMVALYPADSFYPWSPAYNQERVNTWDKVMTEYLHKASE